MILSVVHDFLNLGNIVNLNQLLFEIFHKIIMIVILVYSYVPLIILNALYLLTH